MSANNYLLSYQERQWQVYEQPFDDDAPKLGPTRLSECNSESQMARELKEEEGRFYIDCELLAAGLEPRAGTQVGRLTEEWRGHAVDTLVILSFEKVKEGQLVFAVEV